nr:DUF397 domain-containing protein [Kitasatospora sp. MBT66]
MTHIVNASGIPGIVWEKPEASGNQGNCFEFAALPDGNVGVRNSRFPDGPALVYTRAEVAALVESAKAGQFDKYTA